MSQEGPDLKLFKSRVGGHVAPGKSGIVPPPLEVVQGSAQVCVTKVNQE
jgi:hypothetical protein